MLNEKFSPLFKEIYISRVKIKNRIAMAPMSIVGLSSVREYVSQRIIDYYVRRAKGNVGLIITGLLKVENKIDRLLIEPIISQRTLAPLAELAEAVHIYGSKIFVQLSAGFGKVNPDVVHDSTIIPVSSSALPAFFDHSVTTRALTITEIEKIVDAFGPAARILKEAGIDGIELHGHEGYLFDQFTTALWNKRTDKYGGDLRGRLTLPLEVLKKIKETAGKDYPVIYRFGIKHYIKDVWQGALKGEAFTELGQDIEEGQEMAKLLEQAGFDALHVDAGAYESWYWAHPPIYQCHGCMTDMAGYAKQVVKKVPVITVGRMEIPELAVKVLKEGKADIVALGRGLLADPDWPKKIQEDKVDQIRPCIGCHDGCMGRIIRAKPLCCAVNPQVGRERILAISYAQKKKKITIAGGGISGMEAARIVVSRGHQVNLYERRNELGGHLIEGGVPDFKEDIRNLLSWYKRELKDKDVSVHLGVEVDKTLVDSEKPDTVILATGSSSIVPDIPGINNKNVFTAIDLLKKPKISGEKFVIMGGGLVGTESALWLAKKGKQVTIIERLTEIVSDVFPANRSMLIDLLDKYQVKIMLNASISEITSEGVTKINQDYHTEFIPCDYTIVSVGLKSEDKLYSALQNDYSELYKIGDCNKPGLIMNAIWDGYYIGCSI